MADSKGDDTHLFQFAVISDTHIRLQNATEEGGYASNRLFNERAKYVVKCLNRLQPELVIHLGDVVHPIPALMVHRKAVEKAVDIFSRIKADFYVLPGNHDIGDKPNAWLPAPVVKEDSQKKFNQFWGPTYRSFSKGNCQIICLDTPVMNSGLDRETKQKAWLEGELHRAREKNLRILVFMHYPLFICDPQELLHYDNIDEPARTWLLNVFDKFNVEAVFSGHVHNVFVGIHKNTKFYSLPSTAFVRPEYSELASIGPEDEYGRNDVAKLGFFLVKVFEDRHEVIPIRTYGTGKLVAGLQGIDPLELTGEPSQLPGVTLRRGWARRVELAADGLDEFKRKEAYRDWLLAALLELGVKKLRVPFADLANVYSLGRISDLIQLGFEFTLFSLGIPDEHTLSTIKTNANLLANWEIILPEYAASDIGSAVKRARGVFTGPIYFAPVVPIKENAEGSNTFQHFASHGFSSAQKDEAEEWLSIIDERKTTVGLTFRVSPWDEPARTLREIEQAGNCHKLINLQFPRSDEGVRFDDDALIQEFILKAYRASRTMKDTIVFLDTFIDSDRGYYPRNGLIDRRFNPRPVFYALKQAALSD